MLTRSATFGSAILVVITLFVSCPVDLNIATASEIVEQIVQDWQIRQQLRGARYLVQGKNFVAKGSLLGGVPPDDAILDVKTQYLIDFERNRSRRERDWEQFMLDEERFVQRFSIDLYDGQNAQILAPRDRNQQFFDQGRKEGPWEADLELLVNGAPAFGRCDLPILLAHGMVPASKKGSILSPTGTLRRPLTSEMFAEYGQAVRDGRECVVLRSQPDRTKSPVSFRELWVDVTRNSAILRYVRYVDDKETYQIDMWYKKDDSQLDHYALMAARPAGGLVRTHEINVLEYEPEPAFDDSTFHVEAQPGFNVYDWSTERQYRVGLPGEPDRDLLDLKYEMASSPVSMTRILLVSSSVVLIIVTCLYFFRCNRKK